ncbi:hypothetical protein PVMG_06090 [Plasmodium vivax Mauritania I]|uniref:Variable surface protein Vir35 n=1 Tax=Plasmodium vivax Mauritania I TaxID=1035515 RepID=A0A0J9TK56_PLAVI|nr:hypothetical protein PVMG_06090 [Plasmodium vivax Mauritania I]
MIDSGNLYFNKYLSVIFLIKIFAFLHLILTSFTYNDLGDIIKFLENKNNFEGLLDFRFHRSLEEQEFQDQYEYTNVNGNLLEDGNKNDEEYGIYYVSPYEQLSKRASNNVGVLQRNYKNKFGKKRGLAKLDNYFEKEVFHKLDDIYKLQKKMKNDKKSFKKNILSKYGYKIISFSLLPLFGLILYILYGGADIGAGIIKFCSHANHTNKNCTKFIINDNNKWKLEYSEYINIAFTCIMIIIVFVVNIYILIKVIKYERIKAIKGKMSLKEYCNFCKDLIRKT